MTDQHAEPTDEPTAEPEYGPGPWWGDLGTWGAVGLITFGGLAAAWVFLRLPGTPQDMAIGYYQAAKIIAIGLVIAGSALLSRRRSGSTTAEKTTGAEHT